MSNSARIPTYISPIPHNIARPNLEGVAKFPIDLLVGGAYQFILDQMVPGTTLGEKMLNGQVEYPYYDDRRIVELPWVGDMVNGR